MTELVRAASMGSKILEKRKLSGIILLTLFFLPGCSDVLKGGRVVTLHPATPTTSFEGDAQLGANGQHSHDFDVVQANAGGSYHKKKVASSHYLVSGGIANGVF